MFEDKKFRDYNIMIFGKDGKISDTSELHESWIDFDIANDIIILYFMCSLKG